MICMDSYSTEWPYHNLNFQLSVDLTYTTKHTNRSTRTAHSAQARKWYVLKLDGGKLTNVLKLDGGKLTNVLKLDGGKLTNVLKLDGGKLTNSPISIKPWNSKSASFFTTPLFLLLHELFFLFSDPRMSDCAGQRSLEKRRDRHCPSLQLQATIQQKGD